MNANADAGLERRTALAIDFGGSKVAIARFANDGSMTDERRLPIDIGDHAIAVIERVAGAVREMLEVAPVACIGAVSPGVVLTDSIRLAPNVFGWDRVALAREISDALGGRMVAVANDVKAAAAAELRWGALADTPTCGLYVNLGTGVAVSVVVNGRVLLGANGAAGEIGYNDAWSKPGEGGALLEHVAGARVIVARAREIGIDVAGAVDVFASSDPTLSALVEETLDELAVHLRSAVHLLDPSTVVLGGGLVGSAHRIVPALRERLLSRTGPTPDVVVAHFGSASSLHGARLVALDERWDRR